MEIVAVVQFATPAPFAHDGPLGRALASLLAFRLNHLEVPLRASFVELRDGQPDAGTTQLGGGPEKVICRDLLPLEDLTRVAEDIHASWWVAGVLDVCEESERFSLLLSLASTHFEDIPGQDAPACAPCWEKVFEGELDEAASILNEATCLLASEIISQPVQHDLWVETRSFEAFSWYCVALDTPNAEFGPKALQHAVQHDPYFMEPLAELLLDACQDDDQGAFDLWSGELLGAARMRPTRFVAQLSYMSHQIPHPWILDLGLMASGLLHDAEELAIFLMRFALRLGPPHTARVLDELDTDGLLTSHRSEIHASLLGLALLHGSMADVERIENHALRVGEEHDTTADVLYSLGSAAMMAGHIDRAAACFERALSEDPNASITRGDLAGAYMQLGRFTETVELLEGHCKDHVVLLSNLALALRQLDRLVDAERAARRAVHADPTHPQAWAILGELCRLSGHFDESQRSLRMALLVDPENLFWQRELGRTLFRMGQQNEAMELFGAVMEHLPDLARSTPEILFVMASVAEREQGEAAACELLERALELDPSFWQAANNLGVLLLRSDQPERALRWLQQAHRLDPGNEGILANLERAQQTDPSPEG